MTKPQPIGPSVVLQLMDHYREIRRLIAANYTSEVNKEQALLRLAESEMWIGNGRMKVEGPVPNPKRTMVINYGPQYPDGVMPDAKPPGG